MRLHLHKRDFAGEAQAEERRKRSAAADLQGCARDAVGALVVQVSELSQSLSVITL
jgi:hypothetical protein